MVDFAECVFTDCGETTTETWEDFWTTESGAFVETAPLLEISDCGEIFWDWCVDAGCAGWDPVEYSAEEDIWYAPLFPCALEECWWEV